MRAVLAMQTFADRRWLEVDDVVHVAALSGLAYQLARDGDEVGRHAAEVLRRGADSAAPPGGVRSTDRASLLGTMVSWHRPHAVRCWGCARATPWACRTDMSPSRAPYHRVSGW